MGERMAGLFGEVLPYIYSQSNRLKRHVNGMLSDPMGSIEQTAMNMQADHRKFQGLLDMAHAGDQQAQGDAAEMALGGLLGFAPVGMTAKVGGMNDDALQSLRDKWEQQGVKLDLYGKDRLTLSRIEVPKELRGQGVGSQAMDDVVRYADESGKVVALTPSTDFGASSVARLRDFYKRFGFVENKGRTKDYEISEGMYRLPKQGRR